MSDSLIELLEALGTCGVSDVLEKLSAYSPPVHGLRPVTVARPVAGRAVTVQVAPIEAGDVRPDRHLGAAAVDSGTNESVIVVAVQGDPNVSGAWGGLLSLAASVRGIRGSVVGGLCRDTAEIRDLGYPVFAMGATPTTARGRIKEVAVDVPVDLCGVQVSPGQYVVADADGVVIVPAEAAELVEREGRRLLKAEVEFARQIQEGRPLGVVLGGRYESMTEAREQA